MNLMGIRKYVFFNMAAFWWYGYLTLPINARLISYIFTSNSKTAPISGMDNIFLFYSYLLLLCLFLFCIIEVLARKLIRRFVIEKYFPNFKPVISIEIPKPIVIIYNILFFVGLFFGCIYLILFWIFYF